MTDYIATFVDGHKASTLAHYGIPFMKWGVRRFQNYDGSLTEAGRKRYNSNERKANQAKEKAAQYRAKALGYAYKRDRQNAKSFQTDVSIEKAKKFDIKRGRLEYKAAKLDAKAEKLASKNTSLVTPIKRSVDSVLTRNLDLAYDARTKSPREKAEILNEIHRNALNVLPKRIGSSAIEVTASPFRDVLQSSVADVTRHYKITPRELRAQWDASYDGEEDPKANYVIFSDDAFKKIFPGIDDVPASMCGTYIHDAYVARVDTMKIEEHKISDGKGGRDSSWTISEYRKGDSSSDPTAYINASKNGATTQVELTKDRSFTTWTLDTLGFTHDEISEKLAISKNKVEEILSSYDEDLKPTPLTTSFTRQQSWGLRRYQNEDGTLTEEGRARYKPESIPKSSGRYTTEQQSKSGKARAEFSEPHKSSGRYTTGSKSNKSAERQKISRAKSLRNSGKTIDEVAEILGVPRSTAADYIYY